MGTTIVLDACLPITFGNVGALGVVAELRRHRVVISRRAAQEVTKAPAADELRRFIGTNSIGVATIDLDIPEEQEALVRFDSSPRFRGRGDAEVLALAVARGWIVGSDEVAVQRAAESEIGRDRVAGTLDFLRWAASEGRLTLRQAIELLSSVDIGPMLLKRIANAGRTPEEVLGG